MGRVAWVDDNRPAFPEPTAEQIFAHLEARPEIRAEVSRLLHAPSRGPGPRHSDEQFVEAVRAIRARGELASQGAIAHELGRAVTGTVSRTLRRLVVEGQLRAPGIGRGSAGYFVGPGTKA